MRLLGLHHVTAIAADPQRNIDFYCGLLGLRLVKLTINFDDPDSYHLYYGDELGRPGTILTFFVWPGGTPGRIGSSQITTTAFSIPKGSLGFWAQRLGSAGIDLQGPTSRLGEQVLTFADPDGVGLELVEPVRVDTRLPWLTSQIPLEHAVRGLHGITISERSYERTSRHLTDTLGMRLSDSQDTRFRFETAGGGPGAIVDVLDTPSNLEGEMGTGVVHHVAWRTPGDEDQAAWRNQLSGAGLHVTPVRDRLYFRSIYFREPGGVLFEIATDTPGFTADEPAGQLGTQLKLPPWLEHMRSQISRSLPTVKLPAGRQGVTRERR